MITCLSVQRSWKTSSKQYNKMSLGKIITKFCIHRLRKLYVSYVTYVIVNIQNWILVDNLLDLKKTQVHK